MLQVGSSWTTLPTTLPPHVGDASTNCSVVYKSNNLVLVGSGTTTRESGAVLSVHNGILKPQSTIPGLGHGGRYTWMPTGQVLAGSIAIINDTHLYAVVTNPKTAQKNAHGYVPTEQLYVAEIQKYLSKGLLDNAKEFLGSLACALGASGASNNEVFWKPVQEMEDCGASIAICSTSKVLCAVGGYQTLSPKFYQVFSAKERVSMAARLMHLDGTPEWNRLPDMNFRRKNLCTVVVGNYLYALGGQDGNGKTLNTVERLLLGLGQVWEPVASMKTPRHGFAATATSSGVIVVVGGSNNGTNRLDSCECLLHTQANNQEWQPLPSLQTPRMGASLSIVNSKLVVAGGSKTAGPFWGNGSLATLETLDIVTSVVETPPAAALPALPPELPMAQAEVIIDEDCDTHGVVPVVHAPPTAPGHWNQHQSVQQVEGIEVPVQQPSAPIMQLPTAPLEPTEQQSATTSSASSLPLPIPPPQDKESLMVSMDSAASLPPPLMPPPAVASMPQQQAPTAASRIPKSDDDFCCAVCLERKKQVAFFCGHQVCLVCSPQLTECHICRKTIEGRIQLFDD